MSYQFDHRQLADEMEIFFFQQDIGPGLPVWLPNGVAIREELERFIKGFEDKAGYQRVASPHVAKAELFSRSGHLSSFGENMFPPMQWPEDGSRYYLKPMNCPLHHQVFACAPRSYRQLPLRIAEYGQVYRFESSGALKGLSRVRGLCQNDAHIYVAPEDACGEIKRVLELHERVYAQLGLKGYRYRLSKHDPLRRENDDGEPPRWLECEEILRAGLSELGLPFFEVEGEAAFYGPKIDVQMRLGAQEESIASVQLDFNSADKFNLSYVDRAGACARPWIIHRAPLGSHERFIALLLEYFDGQLPGWLAPVQLLVVPLSENEEPAAKAAVDAIREAGVRVILAQDRGSLAKRLRRAHQLRPFARLIVGARELGGADWKLQLRDRDILVSRQELVEKLRELVRSPGS